VTGIEELPSRIAELKAAVEQVVDEQKAQVNGPPFKILELCDRPIEFDPEAAEDGTVLLVRSTEYMRIDGQWINFGGDVYTHSEMTRMIQNMLAIGADVTLLHRG
jgi:hypothetical protein